MSEKKNYYHSFLDTLDINEYISKYADKVFCYIISFDISYINRYNNDKLENLRKCFIIYITMNKNLDVNSLINTYYKKHVEELKNIKICYVIPIYIQKYYINNNNNIVINLFNNESCFNLCSHYDNITFICCTTFKIFNIHIDVLIRRYVKLYTKCHESYDPVYTNTYNPTYKNSISGEYYECGKKYIIAFIKCLKLFSDINFVKMLFTTFNKMYLEHVRNLDFSNADFFEFPIIKDDKIIMHKIDIKLPEIFKDVLD